MNATENTALPRVIRFEELNFQPRFAYGDQAEAAVVTDAQIETELGAGFGRLSGAEIPWTIKYDEVILVLEGNLTVRTPNGDLDAGPKDCVWLPKGTELTYVSPTALIFYAIHPRDWADAQDGAEA